jgi:hypothetical protein
VTHCRFDALHFTLGRSTLQLPSERAAQERCLTAQRRAAAEGLSPMFGGEQGDQVLRAPRLKAPRSCGTVNDAIDACTAICGRGRLHIQPQALAQDAADRASHGVGLPTRQRNHLFHRSAGWRSQHALQLGLLAAGGRRRGRRFGFARSCFDRTGSWTLAARRRSGLPGRASVGGSGLDGHGIVIDRDVAAGTSDALFREDIKSCF